ARNWPWLVLEESYPIPVSPLFPGSLRREAEHRWESGDLPEATIDREDEAVYRFLCRHDLAMALKGRFVPSLILMRQGHQYLVSCPALGLNLLRPYREIIDTLNALGDRLAAAVENSPEPRAKLAHELWQQRSGRLWAQVVPLRTGLEPAWLDGLAGHTAANDDWEIDPKQPDADTELLAAARMSTGHISFDNQRALLQRLRAVPPSRTPALDAFSTQLNSDFSETGRPFEQGYWLANWLRSALSLAPDEPAHPAKLLKQWGVAVDPISLPQCALEAIAAWGPRHGPVILLNQAADQQTEPVKPANLYRERSTLAHEICHLLIDRERALPVGEVLGGRVPEYAKKRARAFAAELLLPREVAASAIYTSATLTAAIAQLQQRFQVSRELTAWQMTNSGAFAALSSEEQALLSKIKRAGDWLPQIAALSD
ncbi:MAG: ImmA/IrrE family metallo-endopeptidase, partial [Lamprocystis purpurea]|nr:ImmA/IrrE family metallo-endopeptidase [Lamprocystis purpurea]